MTGRRCRWCSPLEAALPRRCGRAMAGHDGLGAPPDRSRSELAAVVQVLFRKRPNRNISACVGIDVEVPSHLPIFVDERNWRVRVHDRDQKDLLGSRDRAHAVLGRWCWLLPRIGDNFLSVQELMRGGFLGNIDGGSCGRVFAGSSLLTSFPHSLRHVPLFVWVLGFSNHQKFFDLEKNRPIIDLRLPSVLCVWGVFLPEQAAL